MAQNDKSDGAGAVMSQARILAFAGSARRESFNKRLLSIAVLGAERAGAQVTLNRLGRLSVAAVQSGP